MRHDDHMRESFPIIQRSYKGCFPFRLSVPSFVYPADYSTNVELLGRAVDEIELLLFESRLESLPGRQEIRRLAALSQELNLSYNIHLPIDLNLCASEHRQIKYSVERLAHVIDLVSPLQPTTHTLHLDWCGDDTPQDINMWQSRAVENLAGLIRLTGIEPGGLSIETLDYPPQWLAPIVNQLDLAACVDIGHLLIHRHDIAAALALFGTRTQIIHLHGAESGRDHLPLHSLSGQSKDTIAHYLSTFEGAVSVELFRFEYIDESLPILQGMLAPYRQGSPPRQPGEKN